jgi:hypothetical protein
MLGLGAGLAGGALWSGALEPTALLPGAGAALVLSLLLGLRARRRRRHGLPGEVGSWPGF